MIKGINRVFEHEGRTFLMECEDLGTEQASFEVRLIEKGAMLWHKQFPYRDLLEKSLPDQEHRQSLHALMEKTSFTVEAALRKGKLEV